MKVQVTVSFPQTFEIELHLPEKGGTISGEEMERYLEQIEKARTDIFDHAAYLMESSQSNPEITHCKDYPILEDAAQPNLEAVKGNDKIQPLIDALASLKNSVKGK